MTYIFKKTFTITHTNLTSLKKTTVINHSSSDLSKSEEIFVFSKMLSQYFLLTMYLHSSENN